VDRLKDNKIDIMCQKLGGMYTMLENGNFRSALIDDVKKGIRQLQYDLELLRKCTLDNPDFKWDTLISPEEHENRLKGE